MRFTGSAEEPPNFEQSPMPGMRLGLFTTGASLWSLSPTEEHSLQITDLPKMTETPSNLGFIKLLLRTSCVRWLIPTQKLRNDAFLNWKEASRSLHPTPSTLPRMGGGGRWVGGEGLYPPLGTTKERQPLASLGPSSQI